MSVGFNGGKYLFNSVKWVPESTSKFIGLPWTVQRTLAASKAFEISLTFWQGLFHVYILNPDRYCSSTRVNVTIIKSITFRFWIFRNLQIVHFCIISNFRLWLANFCDVADFSTRISSRVLNLHSFDWWFLSPQRL